MILIFKKYISYDDFEKEYEFSYEYLLIDNIIYFFGIQNQFF